MLKPDDANPVSFIDLQELATQLTESAIAQLPEDKRSDTNLLFSLRDAVTRSITKSITKLIKDSEHEYKPKMTIKEVIDGVTHILTTETTEYPDVYKFFQDKHGKSTEWLLEAKHNTLPEGGGMKINQAINNTPELYKSSIIKGIKSEVGMKKEFSASVKSSKTPDQVFSAIINFSALVEEMKKLRSDVDTLKLVNQVNDFRISKLEQCYTYIDNEVTRLKSKREVDRINNILLVHSLKEKGFTLSQIAQQLNVSIATIKRLSSDYKLLPTTKK